MDQPYNPDRARRALRAVMKREDLTPNAWAERAGVAEGTLRHFLAGRTESLNAGTLQKLGSALKNPVPLAVLRGETAVTEQVPIVGYVGAGSEVFPIDDHAKGAGIDDTERPPGEEEEVVGVIVRGDSMFPVYRDGDILFYGRTLTREPHILNGQECVVRLTDGRSFVKLVKTVRRSKRFTLSSWNAPDIEDAEIDWAAPVKWVKRRRQS